MHDGNKNTVQIWQCHGNLYVGLPGGASGKEPTCPCWRHKRRESDPRVGRIPGRRAWQPTLVSLPGESHGHRRLAGHDL